MSTLIEYLKDWFIMTLTVMLIGVIALAGIAVISLLGNYIIETYAYGEYFVIFVMMCTFLGALISYFRVLS